MPRFLLYLVVELALFPWWSFREDPAVRGVTIALTALFAVGLPVLAFVNGNAGMGLATLAILGPALAVMVVAHRRITRRRAEEQARRKRGLRRSV